MTAQGYGWFDTIGPMSRVNFIEVEGVKILWLEFSRCTLEEAAQLIDEAAPLIRSQPPQSLLILSDYAESHFDIEISQKLRLFARDNKPFVKCAALVGVTGIRRTLYRAIIAFTGRSNLVLCENLDEGKKVLLKASRAL